MTNTIKVIIGLLALLLVSNCSTYTIKPDTAKNGVVESTPKWYVGYDRVTWKYYQEAASSVSPDMELAVKKSILLAKAKLADRINGEMNNRTTINKNESGTNENLNLNAGTQDLIVNIISETLVKNYEVIEQEILSTGDKSYRSYVMIRVSKDTVEQIIADIQQRRAQGLNKPADLDQKAKELLNKKS